MTFLVLLFLLAIPLSASASSQVYVYRDASDSTTNCYLKIVPDGTVKGLVVRDYSSLPDTSKASPFQFTELMVERGWLVLYTVTTTSFPDLGYHDTSMALLDDMIHEVLEHHQIDRRQIVIGGISSSGTRALRYAQWCVQGKSVHGHRVAAVFAVDPPLDLERFYRSSERIMARGIERSARWEAELMLRTLPQHLGGPPDSVPDAYVAASVYARGAPLGGNARWYVDVPIRLYHEPDIDWWLNERAADYYDFNSIDIAGFVQQVRDLGGSRIELISTSGKGFGPDGKRKPHSWTIVEEQDLASWIEAMAASK